MALIAGLVSAFGAVVAYWNTADRLTASIDDSLRSKAGDLAPGGRNGHTDEPERGGPNGNPTTPSNACPPNDFLTPVNAAQIVASN